MKRLFLLAFLTLSAAAPVAAQPFSARVCTRHSDGYVNVRAVIGLNGRIVGRLYNGQYVGMTGWHGDQDGFRWLQTSSGGWVRGDYLCSY